MKNLLFIAFLLFPVSAYAQDFRPEDAVSEDAVFSEEDFANAPETVVTAPCDCSKEIEAVATVVSAGVQPTTKPVVWWQVLVDNILQLVFALLAIVAVPFVRSGVAYINAKKDWHIQSEVLEDLALKGISFAEEQSRKSVLHNGGQKTPGAQKLDMAVNFVKTQLEASGLAKQVKTDLTTLIESKLYTTRPMCKEISDKDDVLNGATGVTEANNG